jgi:hypothetical protein
MKRGNLISLAAAPLLMLAMSLPSYADTTAAPPATCKDGTTSTVTGHGACSGHGGVQKTAKAAAPAAAATAAAPAPAKSTTAAAGNTDPTGATAKCKDGTYSKSKSHSGACSKHGGVADWIPAAK